MNDNQKKKIKQLQGRVNNTATPQPIALQLLYSHYEESVCWLFQSIQQVMMELSLEKVRPYLFYAKHLLDFHIFHRHHSSNWTEINLEESLNLVLQIFIQKTEHLYNNDLVINSTIKTKSVCAYGIYPSFQNSDNPFRLLYSHKQYLNTQRYELISQLITLALTKKDFIGLQADLILSGCILSICDYKGENDYTVMPKLLSQDKLNKFKHLFKNLLQNIEQMQDI